MKTLIYEKSQSIMTGFFVYRMYRLIQFGIFPPCFCFNEPIGIRLMRGAHPSDHVPSIESMSRSNSLIAAMFSGS